MDPLGPTTQDPDSAAPDSESPIRPNRTKSAVLAALGTGIFLLLAILLLQANGDKRELQDMLDSSNGEVDQLTSDLDAATSQLTDANADLDTAAGVRESIVDFIAVSLSLGGGIGDRDGRCVAEAMDTQLGTEALLRSSLAAAGLTPNPEAGSQFTAGLADAAAECGVPLNSANAAPAISGTALPLFESSDNDRAVGAMAPTVTGIDFEGTEIQISGTGRPTAIVFLAHWCPHCQRESPGFKTG